VNKGQFQKGKPRPLGAGRKKGSVNRKTELLTEKCEEHGIDPFAALLELAKSDDQNIRLSALKEVCQYLFAKRKAVELTGQDGDDLSIKVIIEDYGTHK